jgi:hypothetical protein
MTVPDGTTEAIIQELRRIREDNHLAHDAIREAVNGGNRSVSKQITATDLIVSAAGTMVVLIFSIFAYVYTTDRTTAAEIHKEAASQRKIISDTQIKVTTLMEIIRQDVSDNKENITKLQPDAPRFTEELHRQSHFGRVSP